MENLAEKTYLKNIIENLSNLDKLSQSYSFELKYYFP